MSETRHQEEVISRDTAFAFPIRFYTRLISSPSLINVTYIRVRWVVSRAAGMRFRGRRLLMWMLVAVSYPADQTASAIRW